MKKRLLGFISLALSLLLLLSGCGKVDKTSVSDYLLKNAKYTPAVPSFESGTSISVLSGATFVESVGPYLYLIDDTRSSVDLGHYIYNAETQKVVLYLGEPDGTDYAMALHATDTEEYFFSLTETVGRTTKTHLYDGNGTSFASADGNFAPDISCDIVRLNGKCYRAGTDGTFAFAFNYPDMLLLPEFDAYSDSYYYASQTDGFSVYDRQLAFVSSYSVPTGSTVSAKIVMPNGDMLVQYEIYLDDEAKEYDLLLNNSYIGGLAKYDLKTVVVNAKNGKAKEIDLPYLLDESNLYYTDSTTAAEKGLNPNTVHALVPAYAIENKRISPLAVNTLLVLDKDGSFACLEKVNGETIRDITLIGNGRFQVDCTTNSYVVGSQGTVLGHLADATRFGDKFLIDNKVYASDFTLLYDIEKNSYTLEAVIGNGLLLSDSDGGYSIFGEGTQPVSICRADSSKSLVYTGENFVVTEDRSNGTYYYDFYNDKGQNVLTVSQSNYMSGQSFFRSVTIHYHRNGITVLSAITDSKLPNYYILH